MPSTAPTDADLLPFGYAPGDYLIKCRRCPVDVPKDVRLTHRVDKYATCCRTCAVEAWEQRQRIEEAPLVCDFPDMAG